MANNSRARPSKFTVYLYIPNIVGYTRIILNCYAFAICFSNKNIFGLLYFISFVCDGIDGWCARKFNQGCTGKQNYSENFHMTYQIGCPIVSLPFLLTTYEYCVSTSGAVLDMVTDRISTACLLVILSQVYRPGLAFVSLLALDISSHWLQITFLLGKASHKDVKDSTNWLYKAHYGNRMFMAYCCAACEVLITSMKECSLTSFLLGLSLFGWAITQTVNVIQMKTAADVCVLYDIKQKGLMRFRSYYVQHSALTAKVFCLGLSLKAV